MTALTRLSGKDIEIKNLIIFIAPKNDNRCILTLTKNKFLLNQKLLITTLVDFTFIAYLPITVIIIGI